MIETQGASADTFNKNYQNVTSPTVTSPYHKATTNFDVSGTTMGFTSTYGVGLGAPASFTANQFHWHAGSEHTVDGRRMDLEVHTVHFPTTGSTGTDVA